MKLPEAFYTRTDTLRVARELLGKTLYTNIRNQLCGGIITETEAYLGTDDLASHAFGGRNTNRTGIMYQAGGVAYVYLCYGIHSMFNVVTHQEGIPHAILIRAIKPVEGLQQMMKRRGITSISNESFTGPGKVTQALGISCNLTGISLQSDRIWIADTGIRINHQEIRITTRVGIDYAGPDALLPYRFILENNRIPIHS